MKLGEANESMFEVKFDIEYDHHEGMTDIMSVEIAGTEMVVPDGMWWWEKLHPAERAAIEKELTEPEMDVNFYNIRRGYV